MTADFQLLSSDFIAKNMSKKRDIKVNRSTIKLPSGIEVHSIKIWRYLANKIKIVVPKSRYLFIGWYIGDKNINFHPIYHIWPY